MKSHLNQIIKLTSFVLILFLGGITNGYAQSSALLVDFETLDDKYSADTTIGSDWTDVFNRTNFDITGVDNEDGYYWAVEDIDGSPSITLDQIDVSNASSFSLDLDWVTHHSNDWDGGTYVRIFYKENGGEDQNLLWVENVPDGESSTNEPAAVDTDFDGDGECEHALPAISTTANGCDIGEGRNNFENYRTSSIMLTPGTTTLDIRIDFADFSQSDQGIYLDNINIDTVGGTVSGSIVTFDSNGGSGTMAAQIASTATALSANTFTRIGYAFTDWNTASDGSGTAYADGATYDFSADITLYAQWTAVTTYDVIFDKNAASATGSMSNQSIEENGTANLTLNAFTNAGNTFDGWNTASDGSGTAYADGASFTIGTSDVTLYAQWTAVTTYDVIFDKNAASATGSMSNQSIEENGTANLTLNAFVNDGNTFEGWNTASDGSGTAYADGASFTIGTADVTLYAQWAEVIVGGCSFEVDGGGALPSGWSETDNVAGQPIDRTSYYLLEPGEPGDFITTASYDLCAFDSAVFTVDIGSFGSGDHNALLVEVSLDGGANYTQSYTTNITDGSDETAISPAIGISSLSDDVVVRLSVDATSGRGIRMQNISLCGAGTGSCAEGNTVTFDSNGGSGTMAAQTASTATALSANTFTRTGYAFTDWNTASDGSGTAYADGATYDFTADITLYAQWVAATTYDVIFDKNDAAATGSMSNQSIEENGTANLTLNAFTNAGNTFEGWNTASDGSGTAYADGASFTIGTADVTLYAQWAVIITTTYDVIFDKNAASATGSMSNQSIEENGTANLTLNAFVNDGNTFEGWNTASDGSGTAYADGASFTIGTADVTLYAQWAEVIVGGCSFEVDGGGALPSGWSETDNVAGQPIDKTSYYLLEPGEPGDFITTASYDLCAFDSAVFTVDIGSFGSGDHNALLVEVSLDGGSNYTQSYTTNITEGSAETPISPAIGISPLSDDVVVRLSVDATSGRGVRLQNISLCGAGTGSCAEGNTVTFDSNGGSGTMAAQTASTATALSANAFTRTGYAFTDWNTASDGSGTAYADGATYDFSADITLYAQWTAVTTYDVIFDKNAASATGSMSNQSIEENGTANLTLNAFTNAGNTFDGWNTASDGSGTAYADGASFTIGTSDVTLYAQWTAVTTYDVIFDKNAASATGSMSNQSIEENGTANLTLNAFVNDGNTFEGWNTASDGSGTAYADGASFTIGTADVTLYAQWAEVIVGGCSFEVDGGGALPSGWSETDNVAGQPIDRTSYYLLEPGEPGDFITTASYDLCAFDSAVFTVDIGSFGSGDHNALLVEVSLDGGANYTQSYTTNITDGSDETAISPAIGISPLSDDVVVRLSVDATSGRGIRMQNISLCGAGTGSCAEGNTVTFDSNGGSGAMAAQTASTATALSANAFTRTGYTFTDWNTASDGSGTAYADGATYDFSADITLYAQWTIITFNKNEFLGALKIYPNPSFGTIQFDLPSERKEAMELSIVDLTGKLVLSKTVIAGSTSFKIDTQLGAGIYQIILKGDEGVYSTKVMIK